MYVLDTIIFFLPLYCKVATEEQHNMDNFRRFMEISSHLHQIIFTVIMDP